LGDRVTDRHSKAVPDRVDHPFACVAKFGRELFLPPRMLDDALSTVLNALLRRRKNQHYRDFTIRATNAGVQG
jgi:hypothetical protein